MTSVKYFFNGKLFANILKRNWAISLLFTIAMFFAWPVLLLLYISDRDMETFLQHQTHSLYNFMESSSAVSLVLAVGFAVIISIVLCSYMNKLPSSYFYHSLPIRRESLFLTHYASGLVSFFVAFVFNGIVVTLILASFINIPSVLAACLKILLKGVASSLLWFVVFYTLTWLVGTMSGVSLIHFLCTAGVLYIVPVMYVSFYLWGSFYADRLYMDYYMSERLIENLSIGIRVFTSFYNKLTAFEVVSLICMTLVMIAVAMLIYRKRDTGNAEKAIVFPKVQSVVKYLVIFPATILGGMFFAALTDKNIGWMIFGHICGAFLSFMLMNTILNKSVKEMFKGIKRFGIYCAVFLVLAISVPIIVHGLENYTPSGASSVELYIDGVKYEFSENENVSAVASLERKISKNPGYELYEDVAKYDGMVYDNLVYDPSGPYMVSVEEVYKTHYNIQNHSIRIVYRTLFGIPIAKTYYVGPYFAAYAKDEIRTLTDSDEFSENYAGISADTLDYGHVRYLTDTLFNAEYMYFYSTEYGYKSEIEPTVENAFDYEELIKLSDRMDYDYFQDPTFISIRLTRYDNPENLIVDFKLPMHEDVYDYLSDSEPMKNYKQFFMEYLSGEDDNFGISYVDVCDNATQKCVTFKDKADIEAIAMSCVTTNQSFFTVPDLEYTVCIHCDGQEGVDNVITTVFIDGKAPAFISEAFSK